MKSASFMAPKKAVKKAAKKVTKKVTRATAAGKSTRPVVKAAKKPVSVFSLIRQTANLSLSSLESNKAELEVWALNIAASTHGKNSQVLVAVKNPNGKSGTVVVPDTWIPICLTTQTSKQSLLDSPEFRAALAGNRHHGPLLRIISTEAAYEILNSQEARKEQQRIQRVRNDQREAQKAAPVQDEEQVNVADGKVRKGKPVASGMVIGMTLNHKNGQLEDDQFLNTLKANRKTLKSVDLEYLTANSASGKVKKWAAKQLGD